MNRPISRIFLFIAVVAIILNPQRAFPSFDPINWRAVADFQPNRMAMASTGIGGLQLNIEKFKNLHLEPLNISYSSGHLHTKIQNKDINIEISPTRLREAIKVVQFTDKLVFQTSVDNTEVGGMQYIDDALPKNKEGIGYALLQGDEEFGGIVQIGYPNSNPNPGVVHPLEKALQLLQKNTEYRQLTSHYQNPPLSWPQIYLNFNPNVENLVSFEFKPQVLFKDSFDLPIEVDNKIKKIGELPYLPLMKDVNMKPDKYREMSPALNEAASITATLGILKSACKEAGSCAQLESQIQKDIRYHITKKQKPNILFSPARWDLEDQWQALSFSDFQTEDTQEAWARAYDTIQQGLAQKQKLDDAHNIVRRTSGKDLNLADAYKKITAIIDRQNLANKYNNLQKALIENEELRNNYNTLYDLIDKQKLELEKSIYQQNLDIDFETSKHRENLHYAYDITLRALIKKQDLASLLPKSAKQQFLSYPVPNDPLLQSISSVVLAWNNKSEEAKEKINLAIKLANEHPKDNIEVARIGLYVAQQIKNNEIESKVKSLLKKSLKNEYTQLSKYLDNCLEDLTKCSEGDLRKWEAKASHFRSIDKILSNTPSNMLDRLSQPTESSWDDVSSLTWLHGRFNYLIGFQLESKIDKANRLRFLSHYLEMSSIDSTSKLEDLESKYKEKFGLNTKKYPDDNYLDWKWFIPVTVLLGGLYILNNRISQQKLEAKRQDLERML